MLFLDSNHKPDGQRSRTKMLFVGNNMAGYFFLVKFAAAVGCMWRYSTFST